MSKVILIVVTALYVTGFCAIFALHTQLPVTLGLALTRSALWPLWVTTGHPQGERVPIPFE